MQIHTYQSMNKTSVHRFSSFATFSKTRALKQITLNLTSDEAENLEKYCEQTGKAPTDVIRKLIQGLPVT